MLTSPTFLATIALTLALAATAHGEDAGIDAWSAFRADLADAGLEFEIDLAVYAQRGDRAIDDERRDFVGVYLQLLGEWALTEDPDLGTGAVGFTVYGYEGLNHNSASETLSDSTGSISLHNSNVYIDPILLDELYWVQRSADEGFELRVGMIDLSNVFDANEVANDAVHQFFGDAFVNNPSIPFAGGGGFGAVATFDVNESVYLAAGIGDSSVRTAAAPWTTSDNDSWYRMVEIGVATEIEGLGAGTVRLIPWHSTFFDEDGWGVALSADQALGEQVTAFGRLGVADGSVSDVGTLVSGGFRLAGPFGRADDVLGVGAAWLDPSPEAGERNETMIEVYYRWQVSPNLHVTPDLQVVIDPAWNPEADTVIAGGLRAVWSF